MTASRLSDDMRLYPEHVQLPGGDLRRNHLKLLASAERRSLTPVDRDSGSGGYTLLELLVVLAVIGLLSIAALAVVRPPSPALQLRLTADQLVADLRLARSIAKKDGRAVVFHFAEQDRQWSWVSGGHGTWPENASVSLKARASAHDITFFPDGSSSGGTISLEIAGGHAEIQVDWLTGRVDITE